MVLRRGGEGTVLPRRTVSRRGDILTAEETEEEREGPRKVQG